MNILKDALVTVHLFGGIDISLIGLLLIFAGIVGGAIWMWKGKKSENRSMKAVYAVGIGIVLFGLLAGCGLSAILDTTEAVKTSSYITIFGMTIPAERAFLTINIGEGYTIYWYGVIIAVGFMLALIYGSKRAEDFGIDRDRMLDAVLVGMIGAIFCARLYYVLFDGVPMTSIWDFFAIHEGGIAIYGGVIGALLFGGITAKLRKINVLAMFDLASLGFLIGQAVGRWGNFINQEVYGKETGSSWFGMTGSLIRYDYGEALVHPLFLYESLWCLLVFVLLHKLSKKKAFDGQLFCSYIVLYGVGRFFFEGMRDHDFILRFGIGISISQVVSILAVVVGVALYFILRSKKAPQEAYDNQFEEFFDDPEMLDAAYELLGCSWDSDDDEVDAAYEERKAYFEDIETETDDQRAKVKAKLDEIERAYEYISNSRRAQVIQEEPNGTDN